MTNSNLPFTKKEAGDLAMLYYRQLLSVMPLTHAYDYMVEMVDKISNNFNKTQPPATNGATEEKMYDWLSIQDKQPAEGKKILLFSNGVVQTDTYWLESNDNGEPYWATAALSHWPEIKPSDMWMQLPNGPNYE